ncbi:MAG: peptide-methionine (S)-S-oxide reductase MsrA [Pseudomonadota bacterium]
MNATIETAVLAGGCFWGMEDLIRKLDGVTATRVGYAGGAMADPTYNDVKTGKTGHAEAIRIAFDPAVISYRKLLSFFFQIHDPTTRDRQGGDVGSQYRSAIFTTSDDQADTARALIAELDASGKWPGEIVTTVEPAGPFYDAEDFHQDYLVKYPSGYTCHFVRPDWTL